MKGYIIAIVLVLLLAVMNVCFLGCSAGETGAGAGCTSTDSTATCGDVQYEIHR